MDPSPGTSHSWIRSAIATHIDTQTTKFKSNRAKKAEQHTKRVEERVQAHLEQMARIEEASLGKVERDLAMLDSLVELPDRLTDWYNVSVVNQGNFDGENVPGMEDKQVGLVRAGLGRMDLDDTLTVHPEESCTDDDYNSPDMDELDVSGFAEAMDYLNAVTVICDPCRDSKLGWSLPGAGSGFCQWLTLGLDVENAITSVGKVMSQYIQEVEQESVKPDITKLLTEAVEEVSKHPAEDPCTTNGQVINIERGAVQDRNSMMDPKVVHIGMDEVDFKSPPFLASKENIRLPAPFLPSPLPPSPMPPAPPSSPPLPPLSSSPKDCLPCRLTGAAAFSGLGAYLLYESRIPPPRGGNIVARRATMGMVDGFLPRSKLTYRHVQSSPPYHISTPFTSPSSPTSPSAPAYSDLNPTPATHADTFSAASWSSIDPSRPLPAP
ncbi:hypothetical protein HDU93_009604 [Gonapodya sp. JEL0774]|nr:hypothetical protein HDU93_009604 [Gonapodya sp. JEL0774]